VLNWGRNCWTIKLESTPADLSAPSDHYYIHTTAYDGQTGEMLAFTKYKNLPGWQLGWAMTSILREAE